MDVEETFQLFAQTQLRYSILEADRDAESLRAEKYRKILNTVTGEENTDAAEPQAARTFHATRDALVRCGVAQCSRRVIS